MPYVESALRTKQAVAAARAVLVREGVGRTTMRAVASEAEIPLDTLQYVFPTKQGLLRAVIEDVVARSPTSWRPRGISTTDSRARSGTASVGSGPHWWWGTANCGWCKWNS